MIQAVSEAHVSFRLALAGNFSSPTYFETCSSLSGWSKTNYHGFLNREQLKNLLSKSVAGLVILHPTSTYLPSLPIKMFEYMSAGLPVIASDFPLWRQIITDANCGLLVNPFNIREIADAMNYLYENPEIAQQMGKRGREAIVSKYHWETEFSKLLYMYDQLV